MKEVAKELQQIYAKFDPWVEKRREGKLRKGRLFDCCVRSAVAKLFDFNISIIDVVLAKKPIPAHFLAGTLRGCCEDLIVLAFLQGVENSVRDELLSKWLAHEFQTNLLTQTKFFHERRPFQNVLSSNDDSHLKSLVASIQPCWKALGFNVGGDKVAPSTYALAKKTGIAEVYDFFYRFSCDNVHFNPAVLIRFGWGKIPGHARFCAANFDRYYQCFGLIYGAYLWCLFLQLLRNNLKLTTEARTTEKQLIEWLQMLERWPEIVTFEEMNLPRPKPNASQIALNIAYRMMIADKQKTIIRRKKR